MEFDEEEEMVNKEYKAFALFQDTIMSNPIETLAKCEELVRELGHKELFCDPVFGP